MSSSSNSGTLRPEWEAGEGLGLIDNAPDNDARVSRRILGDVAGDSLEILESASRPDYSVSHLLRRASTSSCVIVPFTRASSRPRRTLSRTYRWYWMSSTEQSSGSLLSSRSTSCFAVLIVPSIKDHRGGPILRGARGCGSPFRFYAVMQSFSKESWRRRLCFRYFRSSGPIFALAIIMAVRHKEEADCRYCL